MHLFFLSVTLKCMKVIFFFLIILGSVHSASLQTYSLGWFTTAYVMTAHPGTDEIFAVRAKGRETVCALAEEWGAQAGINGGFWQADGTPAGALKIDGVWLRRPFQNRALLAWNSPGFDVAIERYQKGKPLPDTEFVVGGTPLLLKDGKMIDDYRPEKTRSFFLYWWHPRTAVGMKEDGTFVFVVIQGRVLGLLGGMTIPELSRFMQQLGCKDALNMDGGSSSTIVWKGKVLNHPGGTIREGNRWVDAVSDAILIR